MKKDLMIDIESMGTGRDPAMIQLAGVYFDRKTGETFDEFCMNLNLDDCLANGFTKDPATEKWWSEQDPKILEDILTNNSPCQEVMDAFAEFLDQKAKVWSHSTFDFPIVQMYMKKFTKKRIPFRNARDIRTLVDLAGINLNSYDWSAKTHNALDDCKFQIMYCVDAMNKVKKYE